MVTICSLWHLVQRAGAYVCCCDSSGCSRCFSYHNHYSKPGIYYCYLSQHSSPLLQNLCKARAHKLHQPAPAVNSRLPPPARQAIEASTQSPLGEVRKPAEQLLKACEELPGYTSVLAAIATTHAAPTDARATAVILLKNMVR